MKVLIVDDCDELRAVLSILLRTKGFVVQESQDGEEALFLLQNQKIPFTLLITDFNMPKMNGLELIQEILRLNIYIKKIIVLSGIIHNENELKELMSTHSNIKFVHKLTSTEELLISIG